MMKRPLSLLLLAVALTAVQGSGPAFAQESELDRIFQDHSLQSLIDEALQLNIVVKVLPPDQTPVWNSVSKNVTIPGRSVAVRLVGQHIRIDAVFTPYQEADGNLILVAQGQVWFSAATETKYFTTFQSVPVSLGEKVLFFPLGLSEQLEMKKTFTLQIEVQIYPYKDLLNTAAE